MFLSNSRSISWDPEISSCPGRLLMHTEYSSSQALLKIFIYKFISLITLWTLQRKKQYFLLGIPRIPRTFSSWTIHRCSILPLCQQPKLLFWKFLEYNLGFPYLGRKMWHCVRRITTHKSMQRWRDFISLCCYCLVVLFSNYWFAGRFT